MIFKDGLMIAGICAILSMVSCSHYAKEEISPSFSTVSPEEAAAVETKANYFVEISYVKGSATLSENAKSSINIILEEATRTGKIEEVILLSWSDQEYPSRYIKTLPRAQRNLAKRRNESLARFVETKKFNTNAVNMAEKPRKLAQWFNTSDSRIKTSLLAAGLLTSADELQYASKASHSVILVKLIDNN